MRVSHVAYHTWAQYVAHIPVKIVHALAGPGDAEVHLWADCLRDNRTPAAESARQAAKTRKWAKARAATSARKTMPCKFCGKQAESFSARQPGAQMRWRCVDCGKLFQTRCAPKPATGGAVPKVRQRPSKR